MGLEDGNQFDIRSVDEFHKGLIASTRFLFLEWVYGKSPAVVKRIFFRGYTPWMVKVLNLGAMLGSEMGLDGLEASVFAIHSTAQIRRNLNPHDIDKGEQRAIEEALNLLKVRSGIPDADWDGLHTILRSAGRAIGSALAQNEIPMDPTKSLIDYHLRQIREHRVQR